MKGRFPIVVSLVSIAGPNHENSGYSMAFRRRLWTMTIQQESVFGAARSNAGYQDMAGANGVAGSPSRTQQATGRVVMSLECYYCERDLRGPHNEDCPTRIMKEQKDEIERLQAQLDEFVYAEKDAFLAGWDSYNASRSRMDMPRDRIGAYNYWQATLQTEEG